MKQLIASKTVRENDISVVDCPYLSRPPQALMDLLNKGIVFLTSMTLYHMSFYKSLYFNVHFYFLKAKRKLSLSSM
jgi:hypothetical protein